jgi:hypothetical protein
MAHRGDCEAVLMVSRRVPGRGERKALEFVCPVPGSVHPCVHYTRKLWFRQKRIRFPNVALLLNGNERRSKRLDCRDHRPVHCGNAIYRDIIRASLIVDAHYLTLILPIAYRYVSGGRTVTSPAYDDCVDLLSALYASQRLPLPFRGVLLIGYR